MQKTQCCIFIHIKQVEYFSIGVVYLAAYPDDWAGYVAAAVVRGGAGGAEWGRGGQQQQHRQKGGGQHADCPYLPARPLITRLDGTNDLLEYKKILLTSHTNRLNLHYKILI